MKHRYLSTPIGGVLIAGDEDGVKEIALQKGPRPAEAPSHSIEDDKAFPEVAEQLKEYFHGGRTQFDLELAPRGTPFQQRVWRELQRIPFGETISYGELARRIGQPTASRAVGAANGKNPLAIVIPCHRVIGANGALVGYGGGMQNKKALLRLEARGVEAIALS